MYQIHPQREVAFQSCVRARACVCARVCVYICPLYPQMCAAAAMMYVKTLHRVELSKMEEQRAVWEY